MNTREKMLEGLITATLKALKGINVQAVELIKKNQHLLERLEEQTKSGEVSKDAIDTVIAINTENITASLHNQLLEHSQSIVRDSKIGDDPIVDDLMSILSNLLGQANDNGEKCKTCEKTDCTKHPLYEEKESEGVMGKISGETSFKC